MSNDKHKPGEILRVSLQLEGKLIVDGHCKAWVRLQGDTDALVQALCYACMNDADLYTVVMSTAEILIKETE